MECPVCGPHVPPELAVAMPVAGAPRRRLSQRTLGETRESVLVVH